MQFTLWASFSSMDLVGSCRFLFFGSFQFAGGRGGGGQRGFQVSGSCTRPQSGTVGFALGEREKGKK